MEHKHISGTAAVGSRRGGFYYKRKAQEVGVWIGFTLFISELVRWALVS